MYTCEGILLNQDCKPIYVRWPRVRLNVPPTTEGTFPFTTCKGACTNEENPVRKGSFQECSSFNHRVGPNQFSSHCQLFQKDKSQILDGYIEADDRYSFYWKYCVKSDKVCSGDYAFNFLSDRYMAGSEIQKYIISGSLEDCLAECLNQNDYLCRSVTFNRTSGGCSLSSQNQLSKPAMIKLNHNPNFRVDYYENNCFNISESFNFDYKCEENGIRVKVNSKLPYTGALYGLYDFFTCKVEPKEETDFEYLFEYPTISKNCSDSIRFKGKEMILEVVLSTDGVEPLYFITPDDLTFQARCPISETVGTEASEDAFASPDSLNNTITNSNKLKKLKASSLVTAPPKSNDNITPPLTLFPKPPAIPGDFESNYIGSNQRLLSSEPYDSEESSGEDVTDNDNKISPLNDHENNDINKEFLSKTPISSTKHTTKYTTTIQHLTSVKYTINRSTKRGLVPIFGTTMSPQQTSLSTKKHNTKVSSFGIDRKNKGPKLHSSKPGIELLIVPTQKAIDHQKLIDYNNNINYITILPEYREQNSHSKEASNITAHISFPNSNTIAVKTGTSQHNSVIKSEKITVSTEMTKETLTTSVPTKTSTTIQTTTTTHIPSKTTTTKSSSTTQKAKKFSNIPEAIEEEVTSSTVSIIVTEEPKRTTTTEKPTTTTTRKVTTTKTTPSPTKITSVETTTKIIKSVNETTEKSVDLEDVFKNRSKKDPVTFEIFHNGQPVEAVVVGSRITLSFTPYYAISPAYMSITGCQVEPIGSLYDWEKEPLAIIKDGCQADHVGLVCPPQNTDYGVRVTVEAFRYQTTAQIQYTCLIRICPFAECPTNLCNPVEGCPNTQSQDVLSSMFKNRAKRYLSLEEIRAALAANPYLQQQLSLANDTLPVSADRMNAVLQQQLVAIGGDHVVRKRLIVVNSDEELKYYVRTGDVPDNFFGK